MYVYNIIVKCIIQQLQRRRRSECIVHCARGRRFVRVQIAVRNAHVYNNIICIICAWVCNRVVIAHVQRRRWRWRQSGPASAATAKAVRLRYLGRTLPPARRPANPRTFLCFRQHDIRFFVRTRARVWVCNNDMLLLCGSIVGSRVWQIIMTISYIIRKGRDDRFAAKSRFRSSCVTSRC